MFNFKQKRSRFSTKNQARRVAKQQRGDKTDEEWVEYLCDVAERQVGILNALVEFEGPEGFSFEVSAVEGRNE